MANSQAFDRVDISNVSDTRRSADRVSVVYPLNLNVATYEELVTIRGIKDWSARMILAKRQEIHSGTPPRPMTLEDVLGIPRIRKAAWTSLLHQKIICFGPDLEPPLVRAIRHAFKAVAKLKVKNQSQLVDQKVFPDRSLFSAYGNNAINGIPLQTEHVELTHITQSRSVIHIEKSTGKSTPQTTTRQVQFMNKSRSLSQPVNVSVDKSQIQNGQTNRTAHDIAPKSKPDHDNITTYDHDKRFESSLKAITNLLQNMLDDANRRLFESNQARLAQSTENVSSEKHIKEKHVATLEVSLRKPSQPKTHWSKQLEMTQTKQNVDQVLHKSESIEMRPGVDNVKSTFTPQYKPVIFVPSQQSLNSKPDIPQVPISIRRPIQEHIVPPQPAPISIRRPIQEHIVPPQPAPISIRRPIQEHIVPTQPAPISSRRPNQEHAVP